MVIVEGQDSVVGIATRCQLDATGCEARRGKRFFSSPSPPRPVLGPTQPPVQRVLGSVPGVKWLGRGFGHPPRSSAEFRKE